jgi:ISXO2-like transposase domain
MLGFGSNRTAWFMAHRIREGMREAKLPDIMGGEGKFVEADETFVGGRAKNRAYKEPPPKEAVMALVEREGRVRSYHLRTANVTADTIKPIIAEVLSTDSRFRTDESGIYRKIGEGFASHKTVNHSANEYVRGDAHTNTVEGFFSIIKHGIYGVCHHVS